MRKDSLKSKIQEKHGLCQHSPREFKKSQRNKYVFQFRPYTHTPIGEQGLSSVYLSLGEALLLLRMPLMQEKGLLSTASLPFPVSDVITKGDKAAEEGGVTFLLCGCNRGSNLANSEYLRKSSSMF